MNPSQPSSLRILCFGASITAGLYRFGLLHHPYALRLEERLKQSLPKTNIEIDIDALSGDTVIAGEYSSRLIPRCKGDNRKQYDWIIMQGGGNDLGRGRAPERIYEEMMKIWRVALDSGAKVLALTVTETADRRPASRARYDQLNKMVMEYKEERFRVADVCRALPWPKDEEEQKRIWDDAVHFTNTGYDIMGDAIAENIMKTTHSSLLSKI